MLKSRADEIVELSSEFLDNFLKIQSWFMQLDQPTPVWDLIVLAGSVMRRPRDEHSDIDLFLVLPHEIEKAYDLAPVHTYTYKGESFEISKFATEKLIADVKNTESLYHWNGGVILRENSKEAADAFDKASSISEDALLDRLWTRFVLFEINSDHMEKLLKRSDEVSFRLCLANNVRNLSDIVLSERRIFEYDKWYGSALEKADDRLHKEVSELLCEPNLQRALDRNGALRQHFVDILVRNGFCLDEIEDWENCHAHRLTFQYM